MVRSMTHRHYMILLGLLAASVSSCSGSTFSAPSKTAVGSSQDPNASADQTPDDLGGADGGGDGTSGTMRRDLFSVQSSNKVDVLMVVDTSGSMREEKAAIEKNMQAFVDNLGTAGLDAQIQVIGKKTAATDPMNIGQTFTFPSNLPPERFALLDQYVHSTDAIGHLNRYFAGAIPTPLPLRAGVPVEVALISDDNGNNTVNNPYMVPKCTAAEYAPPAGKKVTINAIVGKTQGQSPTNAACNIENVGTEHLALQAQTGGTYLDLCEPDWSVLLKSLTDKIVARNSGYKLNYTPDMTKLIEVSVNSKIVDAASYKVDADNQTLTFVSAYTVPDGAEIAIVYYVK